MSTQAKKRSLFDPQITRRACLDALVKLNPTTMMKNPVMFVVEVGSVLTSVLLVSDMLHHKGHFGFDLQITLWLWFTVLFANFAEAMAEGRGKAQADALRRAKSDTIAYRVSKSGALEEVPSANLRVDDIVKVAAMQMIPGDGEVIEGVASVDESAITGESAPVIREAGGDRSAVTGGTRVLSDNITVRITSNPGETFLDRMIALVEGAERQKTPNEIALNILLAGLTIIFLLAVVTLQPFAVYSAAPQTIFVLISLLVCLIPTTIGGLLSAIGIAGMDRLVQRPRRRGRRRRQHPAPRQDRHHHHRQPPGQRVPARARRARRPTRRRRATQLPARRDPRGPLHRGARQGEVRPARPRAQPAPRPLHPLQRHHPHVRP